MPIEVDPSPVAGQLKAAARHLVTAAGAYAIGRGWISADTATLIGGVATTIAPIVLSQIAARRQYGVLAALAASPAVPGVRFKI